MNHMLFIFDGMEHNNLHETLISLNNGNVYLLTNRFSMYIVLYNIRIYL